MKKILVFVPTILLFVILIICIVTYNSKINTLNKSNDELNAIINELKKDSTDEYINNPNNANENNQTKSCEYTRTLRFIDYYNTDNFDVKYADGFFAVFEQFQSKIGPEIEYLDFNNFEKSFVKNQNYEITYRKTVNYNENTNLLYDSTQIIKVVTTNKKGLDQTQESCILK